MLAFFAGVVVGAVLAVAVVVALIFRAFIKQSEKWG